MDYTLDTKAAQAADQMGSRLDETGKYVGVFTRAEATTSKKGAEGIDFSFKSDDGLSADYLTVWTHGKDGKEIYGYKQLMAIMTCLKIKALSTKEGTVEKWDKESSAKVKVSATLYPDLMNKPVGLLLQREAYLKKDQSEGHKMGIFAAFEASTEFTASEILGQKTSPELLDKMVAQLKDKPLNIGNGTHATPATAGDFTGMDDDIPF
jgi:hypothetical protein